MRKQTHRALAAVLAWAALAAGCQEPAIPPEVPASTPAELAELVSQLKTDKEWSASSRLQKLGAPAIAALIAHLRRGPVCRSRSWQSFSDHESAGEDRRARPSLDVCGLDPGADAECRRRRRSTGRLPDHGHGENRPKPGGPAPGSGGSAGGCTRATACTRRAARMGRLPAAAVEAGAVAAMSWCSSCIFRAAFRARTRPRRKPEVSRQRCRPCFPRSRRCSMRHRAPDMRLTAARLLARWGTGELKGRGERELVTLSVGCAPVYSQSGDSSAWRAARAFVRRTAS